MESLIIVVHVLAAIAIIGLVLIQHGKGADMGASFGSGASQTIFGSAGSGNALTKSTTWLAIIFFATSLGLAVLARKQADAGVEAESLLANPGAVTAPAGDVPVAGTAAVKKPDVPAPATEVPATEVPAAAANAAKTAEAPVPAAPAVETDKQSKQN